jgi:hypothetical protein
MSRFMQLDTLAFTVRLSSQPLSAFLHTNSEVHACICACRC